MKEKTTSKIQENREQLETEENLKMSIEIKKVLLNLIFLIQ